MNDNDLGIYQLANLRHWTDSAIECYIIGGVCSKCTLPYDLRKKCRMKAVILELVKKFGKPNIEEYLKKSFMNFCK